MGNILLKQNQIFKFSDRATSPVVKEINICGKMSKKKFGLFCLFCKSENCCCELWGWMQSMVGKTNWDLKVEFHDLDRTGTNTKTRLHISTVCTMLWTGGM